MTLRTEQEALFPAQRNNSLSPTCNHREGDVVQEQGGEVGVDARLEMGVTWEVVKQVRSPGLREAAELGPCAAGCVTQ